jgi:cation:H+ antiporter
MVAAFFFLLGLAILYVGAETMVNSSSRLAASYGIRPLIIGMTVVAFGTSMPEMMVSLLASFKGSADIAAGNIVGSNVANIGLILGFTALIAPLLVPRSLLKREVPFMIGASLLLFVLVLDGYLGFFDGALLFTLLLVFLGYCLRTARKMEGDAGQGSSMMASSSRPRDLFLVLVGIAGLGIGAEMMVRSAVILARAFGISELVIGVSVVAIGTSLPELAASGLSALKGHADLSIGNVLGSNIFNILFVLGVCPMIRPMAVDPSLLRMQLPVMLVFSIGLIPLLGHRYKICRWKGLLLLGGYLAFIIGLFL